MVNSRGRCCWRAAAFFLNSVLFSGGYHHVRLFFLLFTFTVRCRSERRCRWLDAERSEPQHRRISARDVSVACLFMFRVRPGCFKSLSRPRESTNPESWEPAITTARASSINNSHKGLPPQTPTRARLNQPVSNNRAHQSRTA